MKRFVILSFAAALFGVLNISATPRATAGENDIVARMTPAQIAGFLQSAGYAAEIDTDGEGDPMITSGSGGTKFAIVFFGCEKTGAVPDRYCSDLEFMAIFKLDDRPPMVKLNQWNAEQSFGKAYMTDEGRVILEMPVNLTGGVSTGFLNSSLEWWISILVAFEKQL